MIQLKNLERSYKTPAGQFFVLRRVNLEIRDREFMVLVGPSGCGKSTLLRMVAGLEEITSGTILIQVYDGRGRIYARSQSLGAGVMPASALAHRVIRDGHPRYADARFGTEAIRVYEIVGIEDRLEAPEVRGRA